MPTGFHGAEAALHTLREESSSVTPSCDPCKLQQLDRRDVATGVIMARMLWE